MIHLCIEGLDGTGKSTLAEELFQAMVGDSSFCQWIYKTKEPGIDMKVSPGFEIKRPGVNVRDIVLTDGSLNALERELMFYVDASQHRRFIENQGDAIVISDRGLWSHYAYLFATMKTKQMDYSEFTAAKRIVDIVCSKPTVSVYLRGDLDLMNERLAGKKKDVIESNGSDFFAYVLEEYEKLAQVSNPLILDAKLPVASNVQTVLNYLKEKFNAEQLKSGNLELCQL